MPIYIHYFFWISLLVLIYTYIGYGILLFFIVKIKALFIKKELFPLNKLPNVTLLVAAYNEELHIREKIENSLLLDYPKENIQFLFITDGCHDSTPEIISEYAEIELMHQPERQGKIKAIERAMVEVKGEIVVFTDANTILNKEAIKRIVHHFANEKVGVVAGEKRIFNRSADGAAGAGEGFYWKYESKLKKWDDELGSVMGGAGELFAIQKKLYEQIPIDTLIEDFYLSFKIVEKGYKIAYEPDAYTLEEPSISIKEELKRKIRIAAGGLQSVIRLKTLLNPFKFGIITFQYISHRVLRWTLAPLSLPIIFATNLLLWNQGVLYQILFILQIIFYLTALIGLMLKNRHMRLKILFIPYYFCMMNYAVYAGFIGYIRGKHSVLWEKSERRRT